jgi:hypothetical protein
MPFQQAVYRKVTAYGGVGTPGATPTAGAWQLVGLIAPTTFDQRAHLQRLPLAQVGAPAAKFPDIYPIVLRDLVRGAARNAGRLDSSYLQRIPLAQVGAPAVAFPAIQKPRPSDYTAPLSANYWQRLPITPSVVILPAVPFPPMQRSDAHFYRPLDWRPYLKMLLDLRSMVFELPGQFTLEASNRYFKFDSPSSFQITIALRAIGAPQSVTLSVSGLPTGVTAGFDNDPISSQFGTAVLTLTADGTTPIGGYTATLYATGVGGVLSVPIDIDAVAPYSSGPRGNFGLWTARQIGGFDTWD